MKMKRMMLLMPMECPCACESTLRLNGWAGDIISADPRGSKMQKTEWLILHHEGYTNVKLCTALLIVGEGGTIHLASRSSSWSRTGLQHRPQRAALFIPGGDAHHLVLVV